MCSLYLYLTFYYEKIQFYIEYIYIGKIPANVFVNKGNIFLCNILLSYVLLNNSTYIPSSYVSAGNDSGVWCYYPRRSKLAKLDLK